MKRTPSHLLSAVSAPDALGWLCLVTYRKFRVLIPAWREWVSVTQRMASTPFDGTIQRVSASRSLVGVVVVLPRRSSAAAAHRRYTIWYVLCIHYNLAWIEKTTTPHTASGVSRHARQTLSFRYTLISVVYSRSSLFVLAAHKANGALLFTSCGVCDRLWQTGKIFSSKLSAQRSLDHLT